MIFAVDDDIKGWVVVLVYAVAMLGLICLGRRCSKPNGDGHG